MATEILVNDGGAPARIMNLGTAGAAIEAGIFVDINSSGNIVAATDDQEAASSGEKVALGVLLVDAVSGEPTSVITGKGIVCNVQVGDTISADADAHRAVAISLAASFTGKDSGGNDTTFVKVLLL